MRSCECTCGCGTVGIIMCDSRGDPICVGQMQPMAMIALCEEVIELARKKADADRPPGRAN